MPIHPRDAPRCKQAGRKEAVKERGAVTGTECSCHCGVHHVSPTLKRWWLLFFGDHSIQSRKSGEGHLPAALLKCLDANSGLEVLGRGPLSDIDEAKLGLRVQALMESGREEARCLPEVLRGFAPPLEERFLLALGDLERINQNNRRHDLYPFLGRTGARSANAVFPHQ